MTLSPRQELLAIQKKLWRWNKDLIDHSILVKEEGFDAYERAYRRGVSDYARLAEQEEMIEATLNADIIYVGDYHTCNQSQRSFLRILRAVARRQKKLIIGLELLHAKHQQTLDHYLSGRIKEKTFLDRIQLQEHWVFDLWENFKPIFDFCKYHGIRMYAIDVAPVGSDVRARDAASAKLLARVVSEHPDHRLFVFIGDLHIAPKHLPRDVAQELKRLKEPPRKDLILYQNSEAIYWKLAEKSLDDHVEVVRLRDGHFCRMHTPPVVCQRSYLNWLEHEEGEIDYADAKSSFLEILDRIAGFLGIRIGKERDEVEVFTCGDLSFLRKLKEKGFSRQEIEIIKQQILASESYYIAKLKYVYLANLSLNHAAEEASHFLKSVCSGEEEPREMIDAFYANILHEALGFFGSKLINHKRKCYHEKDFENLLAYFQTIRVPHERQLEYETAILIMEYLEREEQGKPLGRTEIFHSRMDLFLSLTHALGYMLGDRLFYGLMKGTVKKAFVRELYQNPWHEEGEPLEVYLDLKKRLRRVKIPKRM